MSPAAVGGRRRSLLAATVAGLVFQVFHLSEHAAQMVMWCLHPQRAAWMSPWAHQLSLWLGRIRNDRIAETTTEIQRGMELLHLVGNSIFLVGAFGLHRFARRHARSGPMARAGLVVQGLHTLEHVALTASLFLSGRAIGLSTGFGTIDGTRLSSYRVWWHGSVNLLATTLCGIALWRLLAAVRDPADAAGSGAEPVPQRVTVPAARAFRPGILARPVVGATAVAAFLLPSAVALAFGRPVAAAEQHDEHAGHAAQAPTDEVRDGVDDGFHLVDVAAEVGLDVSNHSFNWDVTADPVAMMGGGLCWIDVDRDGWLDLFVTDTWSDGEWGLWDATDKLPTQRIFRNDHGAFTEMTEQWGVGVETRANGCVAADLDGDGWTDLYVTTARSNLLFWNEAGTGFSEGGADAGADTYGWQTGVAAGDVDGDGLIDLVVAGYADRNTRRTDATTGFPNMFEPIDDVVLLNQGSPPGGGRPTFSEVGAASGLEPDGAEYGLGVVLVDIDGDGDLDVHVANDTQPNRLYRNDTTPGGPLRLVDIGAEAGADDDNSGMGIASADLDGDRLPDFVVTNLAGQGHETLSSGGGAGAAYGPASDEISDLGITRTGWGVSFGDLDLDGAPDLVIASGDIPITGLAESSEPLSVFCATGLDGSGYRFADSSAEVGLDEVAPRNGRGVALADYDNDGDLDVAVTAIGQPLALLQNRGAGGHWLAVDPGVPTPGLTLRARLASGDTVETTSRIGGSWLSSEDPRLLIGLGPDERVPLVEVVAAGEVVASWTDVEADRFLELTDGN